MALNEVKWYEKKLVCDAVENFHKSKAAVPNIQKEKEDLKMIMKCLKVFLKENHNMCDKTCNSGSAFETLNISGEVPEFDVMFVVQKSKYLDLIHESNGFCTINRNDKMISYPVDKDGNIAADKFRNYFKGLVQKWITIMTKEMNKEIRIVEHGVATQIDVYQKGKLWYHVDLVPCLEVSDLTNISKKSWCVPKPVDEKIVLWRISYSEKETQHANSLNATAKMCIRIVKTLFKLETNGLFKSFTSYHIKTVAFHLTESKSDKWPDENNLGKTVYVFLCKTMNYLKECKLDHFFNSKINILDTNKSNQEQLVNTIQGWLNSEQPFIKVFCK